MILSNRKLKLIIIALLLFIFATFLGMLKPKAEIYDLIPATFYCPNGSSFSEVINDKWYYGCKENNNTFFKTVNNYNVPNNLSSGYYDISGYIYTSRDLNNIFINVPSSCFITNETYGTSQYNTSPNFLNFYCFNVYLQSGVRFYMAVEGNSSNNITNEKVGIGRDIMISPHFDKSTNTAITNIQNNTNNINTSINDSTIDNNQTSSDTTSWSNMNASNGTITNLLTLPITLLQAIVNGLQTTCSSFSLGTLFNTNIVLPCINVGSLIGNGLWTTIDILFSGFMILSIAKKLIKIFNDFTNLKTNQIDEIYGGGNK